MSASVELQRKASSNAERKPEYVGFSNLPNQVLRRCLKNGFEFTLMVVGQSGLGKSTFLNSLFLAEINDPKKKRVESIVSTVKIESKTVKLVEKDVRLKITFVDTPGFGDLVNNSNCWDPIVKFIEDKYADYLNEETKIERKKIDDQLVHLCLYFIAPTGHSIKALDIDCMRNLQNLVNLVPVIAKADTLTVEELAQFKKNILCDMKKHDIHPYEFPEKEQLASGIKGDMNIAEFIKRIPFAVIGSNDLKQVRGDQHIRVREYPWGMVEVENLSHNDFIPLRDLIIRNNLIDLIETTKNVHYENFRSRRMCKLPKNSMVENCDPFTQLEFETKAQEKDVEEYRRIKEKTFKDRVALQEQKLMDKSHQLDNEETEHNRILEEKRDKMSKLLEEVNEMRVAAGLTPTDTSSCNSSSDKIKKKGALKTMFSRS